MSEALHMLRDAIEATGGLISDEGHLVPKGDPEWADLADAYLEACKELGVKPMIDDNERCARVKEKLVNNNCGLSDELVEHFGLDAMERFVEALLNDDEEED